MTAIISDDGQYRYWLERQTEGQGATAVIMVNPSTADATLDDHTIRKLRVFGAKHSWGRMIVGNLFAYRATDVRELRLCGNPVGPDNDYWLGRIFGTVDRVVCAWGPLSKLPKGLRGRHERVRGMISQAGLDAFSIGPLCKDGQPAHPLMLPYSHALERIEL